MAKKKVPVRKSSASKKPKPTAKPGSKKPAKKAATKKAVSKSASHSGVVKTVHGQFVSLGRPKVTADEPLYLLFKEDYHARQIFDFLRVQTVRDLEQFAAVEIIDRLTRPVHESVDRIRARLAEKNRYLCGDEKYLIQYRKQVQADIEKE